MNVQPVAHRRRGRIKMLVLYLDESGDHSLDKIDPQFPMFALAGCVFESTYHDDVATPKMDDYKDRLFGTRDIILHTADISRNKNGFERLKDSGFRQNFYNETNALIEGMDFTIVAACLDKNAHTFQYSSPDHPYDYCLECIVERFVFMLDALRTTGTIIAESRNAMFDQQLYDTFQRFMRTGTSFVTADRLRCRILDLEFRPKSDNLTGLQVADLVVTPIARQGMGKKSHKDFEIIERKFRRGFNGSYHGFGLKRLP